MKHKKSFRVIDPGPGEYCVYGTVYIDSRKMKSLAYFKRCLHHEILMLEKDLTAYYKEHFNKK